MNKINKSIFTLLIAVFLATGCTDFVDPAIPYNEFETGVYLRTLQRNSITFNSADLTNSFFSVVVEVVDETGGKLLKDVTVFVTHRRGTVFSKEASIRTIPASEFAPLTNRVFPLAPNRNFPAKEIRVTATEAISKLGMTSAGVARGDFFEFRLSLTDTKGRTFTNANVVADLAGGTFYDSPFFYRVTVN